MIYIKVEAIFQFLKFINNEETVLKRYFTNLLILMLTLVCLMAADLSAKDSRDSKDVILVLDTSMSMIGYGGKNIFDRVKNSVNTYIDQLNDGDRVTFVSFDQYVKIYPTVIVDDNNDRDIIKKYISMTEAKGKWTHTFDMLKAVYEKSTELEKDKTRQTVIIILTDGIDDPSPVDRKKKVNLAEIFGSAIGTDRYVYLVNLSDLKANQKFQKLKAEMAKYGVNVKLLESGDDPTKGIKDVQADIDKIAVERRPVIWPFLIIAIALAGLILMIIYKRISQLKVKGRLEYWNNVILKPYIQVFDISKRMSKDVFIGIGKGTNYYINDFEGIAPFRISAVREKGNIKMKLFPGEGNEFQYINREGGGLLENGDIFKVANYNFKFVVD